jgi:hypothetical protein
MPALIGHCRLGGGGRTCLGTHWRVDGFLSRPIKRSAIGSGRFGAVAKGAARIGENRTGATGVAARRCQAKGEVGGWTRSFGINRLGGCPFKCTVRNVGNRAPGPGHGRVTRRF